jgi:hypothetical protein
MKIDFSKTTSFKNTEDLMIGNIIQYKKGHLARVEELNDAGLVSVVGVESDYINGRYDIENFYAIPLSSEVFRLLGFHFSSVKSDGVIRSIFHLLEDNGGEAMLSITNFDDKKRYFLDGFGKIKYLHELQNYVRIRFNKNLNFNVDEKDLKFIIND